MQELHRAIGDADCAALERCRYLGLQGNQPPWQGTGIRVAAGQSYTLLADGLVRWSKRNPGLHGGPGFHLWARVSPGGRIVNPVRGSGSFTADVDGELELGVYLGMWLDEFGALDTPRSAYDRMDGTIEVVVLVWRGADLPGLESLSRHVHHRLIDEEIARLRAPVSVPPGWSYLRETGFSDIYRDCSDTARARICLDASDDQGILRRPVDFPLQEDTRLAWRWKLDALPSAVAEDSAITHDYVSIAAEFDNGRDLTWMWSSTLPVEHYFDCPIKAWSARETHYVVRSGEAALNEWHSEQRFIHADVTAAMGSPPACVVAVWLICVASFQHGRARATFEDIRLSTEEITLEVL